MTDVRGLARRDRDEEAAVHPLVARCRGFERHQRAEVVRGRVDGLAGGQARHHGGVAVADAARVDQDQAAVLRAQRVARLDRGRAVARGRSASRRRRE